MDLPFSDGMVVCLANVVGYKKYQGEYLTRI